MNIGERIKQVRLNLDMKQSEFANRLGIGQAALSAIEKGIRNVTDRNITLICSKYKVNNDWLRFGNGEMFIKDNDDIISELSAEHNLSDFEREFLKVYFNLDENQKKSLKDFAMFLQSQTDGDIANGIVNLSEKLKK